MSLLVSVVLMGLKLSALRRLVQVTQRRTELTAALASLRPMLEEEDLAAFLDDVDHDKEQRVVRIGELGLPSGCMHSMMENQAIERCLGMLDQVDNSSASGLNPAAARSSRTMYDAATGVMYTRAEAQIRADVLEVVAHTLNLDSRTFKNGADPDLVRFELLETINAHHTIAFWRYKVKGFGIADRTFLMAIIAKQLAEDPRSYAVAAVPIPSHAKIHPKDEAGAVRAENYRSFRFTEVAPGVTKMELHCSLRLPRWSSSSFTKFIVPKESLPQNIALYFQQVRPLSECEAQDGRLVGSLLIDLVKSNPKDLAIIIRHFVHRTAMLRECGFRHIGAMLHRVFAADAQIPSGPAAAASPSRRGCDPSLVTEKQANAIGSAIASGMRRAHVPATALQQVVMSNTVLRTMKATHVWFVPMLEVVTGCTIQEPRQSVVLRRLTSIAVAAVPWVKSNPSNAESNADGSNEERSASSFSSVVRLTRPILRRFGLNRSLNLCFSFTSFTWPESYRVCWSVMP